MILQKKQFQLIKQTESGKIYFQLSNTSKNDKNFCVFIFQRHKTDQTTFNNVNLVSNQIHKSKNTFSSKIIKRFMAKRSSNKIKDQISQENFN